FGLDKTNCDGNYFGIVIGNSMYVRLAPISAGDYDLLRDLVPIMGYECRASFDYCSRRAVIDVEYCRSRGAKVGVEIQDIVQLPSSKTVDRLPVVTHSK